MGKDFKSIVVLLLTQAMINLGEIRDPVRQSTTVSLEKGRIFIELLECLRQKTRGNLTEGEREYLEGVLKNIRLVYQRKSGGEEPS